MQPELFQKGKYTAKLTHAPEDVAAAQRLRYRAFFDPDGDGQDVDRFDDICLHVLISETATGILVACYRVLLLETGADIGQSYSAQFYDLASLSSYAGRMVEMGRFCILPGRQDPDILRVAWAMMTRFVDANGIEMMFGCSSFEGTSGQAHMAAFAMLAHRFQAPQHMYIGQKAPDVFAYLPALKTALDTRRAMRAVPPLLRTYLMMGGWVSDHAVIDTDLNTLHVFTGLEVKAVPPERARALRAVAHDPAKVP